LRNERHSRRSLARTFDVALDRLYGSVVAAMRSKFL